MLPRPIPFPLTNVGFAEQARQVLPKASEVLVAEPGSPWCQDLQSLPPHLPQNWHDTTVTSVTNIS